LQNGLYIAAGNVVKKLYCCCAFNSDLHIFLVISLKSSFVLCHSRNSTHWHTSGVIPDFLLTLLIAQVHCYWHSL